MPVNAPAIPYNTNNFFNLSRLILTKSWAGVISESHLAIDIIFTMLYLKIKNRMVYPYGLMFHLHIVQLLLPFLVSQVVLELVSGTLVGIYFMQFQMNVVRQVVMVWIAIV